MNKMTAATPTDRSLPSPAPRRLAWFRLYARWYLRRHFHALRVANADRIPGDDHPLILFGNHASWWDPLAALLLAESLLPSRDHYAPMDATALAHYGVFRPLGFFPVENGTRRGAAQFLHFADQVLARPGSTLWITPESQFVDVRRRPVEFRSGLGALIARAHRLTCVPVAIEYTFWNERLPEILVNIGEPLRIADGQMEDARTWTNLLGYAQAATLDELAMLAIDRDPDAFVSLLDGGAGIGGIYSLWKRLQSAATGRRYHPDHGSLHR